MSNIEETTIVVDETELDTVETKTPEVTLETVIEDLTEGFGDETTPYAIFKVLEGIVEVFEVDRVLKPQMFYNYSRNGMIAKREMTTHETSGKKINTDHRYTREEVVGFVTRYATRNLVK